MDADEDGVVDGPEAGCVEGGGGGSASEMLRGGGGLTGVS